MGSKHRRELIDHSIIQVATGSIEQVTDPERQIEIIDGLDYRLALLRGRAVLKRAVLQADLHENRAGGDQVDALLDSAFEPPDRQRGLRIDQE